MAITDMLVCVGSSSVRFTTALVSPEFSEIAASTTISKIMTVQLPSTILYETLHKKLNKDNMESNMEKTRSRVSRVSGFIRNDSNAKPERIKQIYQMVQRLQQTFKGNVFLEIPALDLKSSALRASVWLLITLPLFNMAILFSSSLQMSGLLAQAQCLKNSCKATKRIFRKAMWVLCKAGHTVTCNILA